MAQQPVIRRLKIERFRGLQNLDWKPTAGVNVIIGGGDTGKTTILEAIGFLFAATGNPAVQETDYFDRATEAEFCIEATVTIPDDMKLLESASRLLLPWSWKDGAAAALDVELDGAPSASTTTEPVFVFRVRGNRDMEITWEIVQPDSTIVPFSVGMRRRFGIVRLSGEDRNDRDLRLVFGSALDRLVSQGNLKAKINQVVSKFDVTASLDDDKLKALGDLAKALEEQGLPKGDRLGLTTSQGISIGSLIGLQAEKNGVHLPLSSWGAGTRRMVSLAVAARTEARHRIALIDEIERGLEPYRLRSFVEAVQTDDNQCFVTTHSPLAFAYFTDATVHFMDASSLLGTLDQAAIQQQQHDDPETFLSRFVIVCEGVTEVGFLKFLLQRALTKSAHSFGIHITSGGGNEKILPLLESMASVRLACAGFCDDEGTFSGRWAKLKQRMGARLLQWPTGCTESSVIALIADDQLWELVKDRDGEEGRRARTLQERLGITSKDQSAILAACSAKGVTATILRSAIIEAATGSDAGAPVGEKKNWKRHERIWFKSEAGGRELAQKVFAMGAWPKLEAQMLPLLNTIRQVAGEPPLKPGDLK